VATVHFYWIGAIPAMVFLGLVMMPFSYGAKVRGVPEYCQLRFLRPCGPRTSPRTTRASSGSTPGRARNGRGRGTGPSHRRLRVAGAAIPPA
jgi:hypothetical protein